MLASQVLYELMVLFVVKVCENDLLMRKSIHSIRGFLHIFYFYFKTCSASSMLDPVTKIKKMQRKLFVVNQYSLYLNFLTVS